MKSISRMINDLTEKYDPNEASEGNLSVSLQEAKRELSATNDPSKFDELLDEYGDRLSHVELKKILSSLVVAIRHKCKEAGQTRVLGGNALKSHARSKKISDVTRRVNDMISAKQPSRRRKAA